VKDGSNDEVRLFFHDSAKKLTGAFGPNRPVLPR
jgi:hypothetical protein